jgi:hypothetical protein
MRQLIERMAARGRAPRSAIATVVGALVDV